MISLPKTVTRQRCSCDLNPGPSAPESNTLTTRLSSHLCYHRWLILVVWYFYVGFRFFSTMLRDWRGRRLQVSLLIYKCLHQAAPLYLTEMCVPVSATQRRHGLRSAVRGDLEVPRCNLARYGQRSFYVSGPSLWNSLPLTVRDSSLTLNTVLYEAKDISVYSSLQDITIAPP